MEEQEKYTVKKPKKKLVYEMMICYVDKCNKFQNALVDSNYQINSRERAYAMQNDLRRFTNDNFRAIVSYQVLRKKYVEDKDKK